MHNVMATLLKAYIRKDDYDRQPKKQKSYHATYDYCTDTIHALGHPNNDPRDRDAYLSHQISYPIYQNAKMAT